MNFPNTKIERYLEGKTATWSDDYERGYNHALLELHRVLSEIEGQEGISEVHPPIMLRMLVNAVQNRFTLDGDRLDGLAIEIIKLED